MTTEVKQLLGRLNDSSIRSVFAYLNEKHDSRITFLQFGGNDGKRGDPINAFCKRHSWSGVIVEPIPEYFARLAQEYIDCPGVSCESVAISSISGSSTMHFVPFAEIPADRPWEQGLASLELQHLIRNGVGIDRIRETLVPVVTTVDLLKGYPSITLNIVVIDAEGHEAEIIGAFPWEETLPECIVYESKHLSDIKNAPLLNDLKKFGYSSFKLLNDTICIQKPPQWLSLHLGEVQRASK